MVANGHWTDFITDFMTYTEGAITTELHRKWSAISCMAGALGRRVWARAGDRYVFGNLYVILVAPPGTGKYIIESVRDLWTETVKPGTQDPAFQVAPDSVSRASLIDDLSRSTSTILPSVGSMMTYHSLLVPSEEFEVLLPSYDSQFISILNSIFNNKPFHRETRRHGPAKDIQILNPQFNILAGATPAYFTAHFPEEAWGTGLIRRIIMVYSAERPIMDIFLETPDRSGLRSKLLSHLSTISVLYGQAQWNEESWKIIRDWNLAGGPPVPSHSKLVNYNATRTEFVLKLSLISGVARTGHPVIDSLDVRRAMEWLFEAEALMPDVFRAMVGKSDSQVIEELHFYLQSEWLRNKQQPIQEHVIKRFLAQRLPSEKIPPVMTLAEGINVIARVAGTQDLWIPRPKHLHGVE